MDRDKIIGSRTELVIKDTTVTVGSDDSVVTISGYANKYLDEQGSLVIDRSQESVLPQGYDLEDYMKNPILLYMHNQDQPIGKVINVDVRVDGLYIEAEVHKAMNEKAFYGIKNGILKTFSIGFSILDYAEVDGVYLWTKTKLLEISIVSVPDNQDSLFSVLTDAPCQSGTCLLGSKAVRKSMNPERLLELRKKDWKEVDKQELKKSLAGSDKELAKEAYLVVKDVDDSSTWKFPHHDYVDGQLILNKGGVISAFSALKSIDVGDILSAEARKEAAEHLKAHFDDLYKDGLIEEALLESLEEFICNLSKEAEEQMVTKEENTSGDDIEQQPLESTINTQDDTEDGNTSNSHESGEEKAPDSEKVEWTDIESFIGAAKQSEEGVEQLFMLYAQIADTLNEVLTEEE